MKRKGPRYYCTRCGQLPRSSPWSSYCDPCRAAAELERKAKVNQPFETGDVMPLGLAPNEPVLTWDGYGAEFNQYGKRAKMRANAHFGRSDAGRVGGFDGA